MSARRTTPMLGAFNCRRSVGFGQETAVPGWQRSVRAMHGRHDPWPISRCSARGKVTRLLRESRGPDILLVTRARGHVICSGWTDQVLAGRAQFGMRKHRGAG